jgi:hypothetical protein
MKTFVQLKDGIGFAVINTAGETEGIEVSFGTGDNYLGQLYSNGSWSVAPIIKYAILDENGNIVELRQTKFPSELGPWPEWNSEIPTTWKYVNGAWIDPNPTIIWNDPEAILQGTALSETQLNATCSVPGILTYIPELSTVLNAGIHTLSVTLTPDNTSVYNTVTKNVMITVIGPDPIILTEE